MIGTLLIIIPLLIGIACHYFDQQYYNDGGIFFGKITGYGIAILMTICAVGMYVNTSTYETERNSIQQSLDSARASGSEYELATIQREVIEFNKRLDLDANFWHKHFKLWINDDILDLEPVK